MKKVFITLLAVFYLASNVFAQKFSVSFPDSLLKQSFSGNILLYLSKDSKDPKSGTAGLDIFPCYRVYVKNIKPGQAVIIGDKAISYPVAISDMERNSYYIQAVWDRDLGGRSIGNSPGNLYSAVQKIRLTKNYNQLIPLKATKVVPEPVFKETQFVKELKVNSALLSNFSHRPTTIAAAVILPKQYFNEPNRKFPVRFNVSGYGGDYQRYSGSADPSPAMDTTAVIVVYLDGNCRLGHSVYANSDNNGPWGDALTTELIPQLEKTYRCNGARLLNGHSSGGWTVLWLQTHYPKVFDACWSSSPDPVDFRSFQRVNLYEHQNMYYGKDSTLNQTGTIAGFFPWFNMRDIYTMEHVIYRGEQMHSFDAVFSEKGSDGEPRRIINYKTGEIDAAVFEHWKNYDISLYLRTNWDKIKGDLDGKVRVTVGEQDNFLLNYAVKLLDGEMKKLNSSFVFGYYPGDHFTVSTPEVRALGNQFLEKKYQEWLAKHQ
ncbi:alpha/beta hydrolase-fold protein [Mucilaginibacter sp. 22184]|uniref:alpha/beta hydrolase-fold protein n=1 Tax=Mucilaginibacter sp. 22184 TaxID=3453887 RepID=UPI003F85769C